MKQIAAIVAAAASLGGCTIASLATTAVTAPVKVAKTGINAVSAGVDAVTTSQSEADEKRGREARKADEKRGREVREMVERCRRGRPLATDDCGALRY